MSNKYQIYTSFMPRYSKSEVMNIIYKPGMSSRMVTYENLGFGVVTIIKHKIKLSTLRVGYQR